MNKSMWSSLFLRKIVLSLSIALFCKFLAYPVVITDSPPSANTKCVQISGLELFTFLNNQAPEIGTLFSYTDRMLKMYKNADRSSILNAKERLAKGLLALRNRISKCFRRRAEEYPPGLLVCIPATDERHALAKALGLVPFFDPVIDGMDIYTQKNFHIDLSKLVLLIKDFVISYFKLYSIIKKPFDGEIIGDVDLVKHLPTLYISLDQHDYAITDNTLMVTTHYLTYLSNTLLLSGK